ncbi:TolC family protein [Granulicella sp. S190]|uniref:TolC family protein n=1 Tax=Granulicella sp. S190 TaxID=1747226 RepID=UPI00131C58F5|nr:TolC family protein [Granulicella sp. S190]
MNISQSRHSPNKFLSLLVMGVAVSFFPAKVVCAQDTSKDLTLSQAIDLALAQNRTLKLARLSIDDSRHKKQIARSSYYPQITNQSSFRYVTQVEGVEIPAGAFGTPPATGPIPAQKLFLDQGSLTSYQSITAINQPVTQLLKVREANRAATADINTAKIKLSQAEDEIALRTRQLFYNVLIAQLRKDAATEEVDAGKVKFQESTDDVARGHSLEIVALESHAALLDAQQTVLTETLQLHDLTLTLDDLLGLPLNTKLHLLPETTETPLPLASREDSLHTAEANNPEILAARQSVIKARASLAASKDEFIPDLTLYGHYDYQSGTSFLVHNFGAFGFNFKYDLFDGGRRVAQIKDAHTILAQAELSLQKLEDEVTVQVETAYDKVQQLQQMVDVAKESLEVRVEASRLSDRQFEQNAALASAQAEAHAKSVSAQASLLEANLGLSLAQGDLKRIVGEMPR